MKKKMKISNEIWIIYDNKIMKENIWYEKKMNENE